MVQINPQPEPLPRFQEGFQLCVYIKYILFWTAHYRSKIEIAVRGAL